jgi:hypothetical protein
MVRGAGRFRQFEREMRRSVQVARAATRLVWNRARVNGSNGLRDVWFRALRLCNVNLRSVSA